MPLSTKVRRIQCFPKWVLASGLCALSLYGDPALVEQIEKLRNELGIHDVQRAALGLRIADLLFDEVRELAKKPVLSETDLKTIDYYQTKALGFYGETLTGKDGQYPPVSGLQKIKVNFQRARILTDRSEWERARPIWEELSKQSELIELKREAALRLAEYFERSPEPTKAEPYYRMALELSQNSDLSSFIQYRLGWFFWNRRNLEKAIDTMKLALWDSKKQIREEALRDYILFNSSDGKDGERSFQSIEPLATSLKRPELIIQLADAYFSQGNKRAGIFILEQSQNREPLLKYQVKLLEELYGQRQWDKVGALLTNPHWGEFKRNSGEDAEIEKLLARLVVQLDGERVTSPEHLKDFLAATELTLSLFPKSPNRLKLVEGWLAAETRLEPQRAQLTKWISNPQWEWTGTEQKKLREFRLARSQKANDLALIVEDAQALSLLTQDAAEARKYKFYLGLALYEQKQFVSALPLLEETATVALGPLDSIALQAKMHALDILAQTKQFAQVITEGTDFLSRAQNQNQKEKASISALVQEAKFQQAVSQGNSATALSTFKEFCLNKEFTPQSCTNAENLAVSLKDQPSLLILLKAQGKQDELALEMEAAAHFEDAANLKEKKLTAASPLNDYLHVALLYELGENKAERDRISRQVIALVQKTKSFGESEALVWATLKEADLLSAQLLSLPWSTSYREQLAEALELKGIHTKETEKILMDAKVETGPQWKKHVLSLLENQDKEQRKIKFYGNGSKTKFERRLARLKALTETAEKFLDKSRPETQTEILTLLSKSYSDLAQETIDTPMPDGITDEVKAQVQTQLGELAHPFKEKAEKYAELRKTLVPPAVAPAPVVATAAPTPLKVPEIKQAVDALQYKGAIEALHKEPFNIQALTALQEFYSSQGKARLSAYFKGRLTKQEGT